MNLSDYDNNSGRDRSFSRSLRKITHPLNISMSNEKKISEEYAVYGLSKLKLERNDPSH